MNRARGALAVAASLLVLASGCSVHRLGDDVAAGGGAAGDGAASTVVGATEPGVPGDPGSAPGAPGSGLDAAGKVIPAGQPGATVPGGTGAATTVRTSPPATNAPAGEARRASDRGITPGELSLGILAVDEGFFAAAGAGSTKKAEHVVQPFIEEINKQGGINGRKVIPKISRYDPLSAESMQAACVNQAEDHKVFATLAQSGFYGDAEVCLANKQVPTITFNTSSADTNYNREKGFVRQMNMNKDRNQKTWIDWMVATGIYTKSSRPGLIYVDVPEDVQLVEKVLLPYIKSKGLPDPSLVKLSASIAQTPSEAQSAVIKFKGEDVNLVLPFVSFLRIKVFAEQAEAAVYRPKYSVSDFGLLATDAMAGMNPNQWDGVMGITALKTGVDPIGQPPGSAEFKECEATYKAHGQNLARDPNDASKPEAIELTNMMFYCQHVAFFADVARRSGVNPTKASFLGAIGATGTWSRRVVFTEALTFTPTKYDGADSYAVVRWQKGCTSAGGCYRQIVGFKKTNH